MSSAQRLMFASSPPSVELESFTVAAPTARQVLVRNQCTQVSAGSESNFLRHGPASYGLPESQPRANIGYMTAGRIEAVGAGVTEYAVGDRVIAAVPPARRPPRLSACRTV